MKLNKDGFIYQSVHTLFTRGLNIILVFAGGIVSARLLGPEGKGTVAFLQALPLMIQPLGELGIRQSAAYLMGQKKHDDQKIYQNIQAIYCVTSILCLLLLSGVYFFLGLFRKYGTALCWLYLASVPLVLFQSYQSGILIAKKQIQRINYIQLLDKIGIFVLLIVFLGAVHWGVMGVGLGNLLTKAAGCVLLMLWLKDYLYFKPRWTYEIFRQLITKGFLFAAALFVIQLNYRFDVLMLERLRNEYSVGIYSVGVNICEILKEVPLALGLVLFSRSANWNLTSTQDSLVKTIFLCRCIFNLMIVLALGLGFIGQFFIPIFYGDAFRESIPVIWMLLPGVVMLSIFLILSLFAAGQGMPQLSIYAFLPALFLNIALNFYFIPKWNYLGAALCSSVSYSAAALFYAFLFKRIYKVRMAEIFFLSQKDLSHFRNLFQKVQTA